MNLVLEKVAIGQLNYNVDCQICTNTWQRWSRYSFLDFENIIMSSMSVKHN